MSTFLLSTVLAKKSSRFYTVKLCKNVNFFWPVLYVRIIIPLVYSSRSNSILSEFIYMA